MDEEASLLCRQTDTGRDRDRERDIDCGRRRMLACLLDCLFAGKFRDFIVSIVESCMFVMWCEEHCCLLSVCAVKDL